MSCVICNSLTAVELKCQHQVCVKCILDLFSSIDTTCCPVCRASIDMEKIINLKPCAKCHALDTQYCEKCENFFCDVCWPQIHCFKPAIFHQKTNFDVNIVFRKVLFEKLGTGLTHLKNIDEDIIKLKDEGFSKTPSIKDRTLDEVKRQFNKYHLKLDDQQQAIVEYITASTTLKLEHCLKQKVEFKSYVDTCKSKVFEHQEAELTVTEGLDYNSDLDYHLIMNSPPIPEIISIPDQEVKSVDPFGVERWFLKGQLHRSGDRPAVIYPDGKHEFYKHGRLHRDGGPAVITANGDQYWYYEGLQHRDNDLPAVIYTNGGQAFYQHGKYHRDNDQPAYINKDGGLSWYQYGLYHRENNLPAQDWLNGAKAYMIWGKCHRTDGPALITDKGKQTWYHNGVIHREGNEPAVINPDGLKEWYLDGKKYKQTWANGNEEYFNGTGKFHRDDDLPARIIGGIKYYMQLGKYHRNGDAPAIIYPDGRQDFYKNGVLHRDNGDPAIIHANGNKEYYINGVKQNV